jgi:hypothetical protein
MSFSRVKAHCLLIGLASAGLVYSASAKDVKITAEELVTTHLQSLGQMESSAERFMQGKVVFTEVGGKLHLEGTSSIRSQGTKFKYAFQFANPKYPGEQFVFDGQKVMVAMIDATSWSNLGNFLHFREDILQDGLFGGTLSSAWTLFDIAHHGATLKYQGMKKIEGRELHDLLYIPNKHGGGNDTLSVHLYFDPETYHHVMTIYALTMTKLTGGEEFGIDQSQQTLEERFDDFRPTNGLVLPWHWTVRYHAGPEEDRPHIFQWESKFENFGSAGGK